MPGTVLITGGAGYIGSHIAWQLLAAGYETVVCDDLSTGNRWAVHPTSAFVEADLRDRTTVHRLFETYPIDAVIHCAGRIVVSESVRDPLAYYGANVEASRILLEACVRAHVDQFVFSSSAAVYGSPAVARIDESLPPAPVNPYGRSKLMTEWMLEDVARATAVQDRPLRYVALRYFNVAGARADGRLGQAGPTSTHIVKVACEAALGARRSVELYGTDYPTPDGTCVRDYLHVEDLAAAHLCALEYLAAGGAPLVCNCGYGRGYSVREILAAVSALAGRPLPVHPAPRRPGDPPRLVADGTRAHTRLGWRPQRANLQEICASALAWEGARAGRGRPHPASVSGSR